MKKPGNIVIGDRSAEHFLLHEDAARLVEAGQILGNPLAACACGSEEMGAFNPAHPLYGGEPVIVLVPGRGQRRESAQITCRCAGGDLPERSFFRLRDGLYMATPEFAFLRAAAREPVAKAIKLAIDLCGKYYLRGPHNEIADRTQYLTSASRLREYINSATGQRGSAKAKAALAYIADNSGSPAETQTWMQFCLPVSRGGFGLGFTHMNYDINAGRLVRLTEQSDFCIDIAAPQLKCGLEYDGQDYHSDAGKDKRRRNELKILGWDVFPIDASVLYHPDATVRFGEQMAKVMGKRLRLNAKWEQRFVELRQAIDLPA